MRISRAARNGFRSVFGGSRKRSFKKNNAITPYKQDWLAIYGDWKKVGESVKDAIGRYGISRT